jgi:hypothetical protein
MIATAPTRCQYCRRPIRHGDIVARAFVPYHPRCVVIVLMAEPRQSEELTHRAVHDLIPAGAR